jgi:hypothetical protein
MDKKSKRVFPVRRLKIVSERYYGFEIIRSTGVASLFGVQWGMSGSPPA